jgi:hypothetical protein
MDVTDNPERVPPGDDEASRRSCAQTLIYELLDAHVDTLLLASDLEAEPGWSYHLTYLRDLQRVAREFVAST